MKVKSESEVSQSCQTLSDPVDCSLPGFSIHRIFQARVLEWGAIASPITSWQIDGKTMETVTDSIFLDFKSLQMVTAAMKLKDAYSLEEKL